MVLFSLFFPSLIGAMSGPPLASANSGADDLSLVHPLVNTSHGLVRGKTVQLRSGHVDAFLGIPYAKAPIGPLRFEKTRPLDPDGWKGNVLDATREPPMCVPWVRPANWEDGGVKEQFSEDCLFLNLFRPHFAGPKSSAAGGNEEEEEEQQRQRQRLMPVMAVVHGGGFQMGSARRYSDLEDMAQKYLSNNILVAVIQFRIGIFGYASTGQSDFGGNFGYWDQTEALKWLRHNLAAFGGDPQRVTLFGYSSGSSSVGTLSVSPHSRDLFSQCIQMSGSVMVCRAASDLVVEETVKLAHAIGGCPAADGEQDQQQKGVKDCLKRASLEQIFDAVDKIGSTRAGLNYVKFGPRLDGDFLPADFDELIRAANPKPTILGLVELEPLQNLLFGKNSSLHWDAVPWDQFPTFGRDQFDEYVGRMVVRGSEFGEECARRLRGEVVHFYTEGGCGEEEEEEGKTRAEKGPDFYLERLVQLMADLQFYLPFALEVQARANAGNRQLFTYVNKYVNPRIFPPQVKLHKNFHDNDHQFVFRNPASDYEFDADDRRMADQMAQFIVNFVKTGDPSTDHIHWQPALSDRPFRHLSIQLPAPLMSDAAFDQRRLNFWNRMTIKYPMFNLITGKKGGTAECGTRRT